MLRTVLLQDGSSFEPSYTGVNAARASLPIERDDPPSQRVTAELLVTRILNVVDRALLEAPSREDARWRLGRARLAAGLQAVVDEELGRAVFSDDHL